MTVWGLLIRSAAADSPLDPDVAEDLGARLDGLVEVMAEEGDGTPASSGPPDPDARGRIAAGPVGLDLDLAAVGRSGLEQVPDDASAALVVDDRTLQELGARGVMAFIDHLAPDIDAVVRAVPVTDALKRVADGRVVGGVEREGLFAPGLPQVLRHPAPASGRTVRFVTDEGRAVAVVVAA